VRFLPKSIPRFFAEVLSGFSPEEARSVLKQARQPERSEIFSHLEPEQQLDIIEQMRRDDVASLFAEMSPDDRADLFKRLPDERRESILPGLAQAIEHLRTVAPDRETIYYAYVIDTGRQLLGFVSLKDLILARRDERILNIMHRDIISARVDEDQEEAAAKIQRFDLLALPVINGEGSLVGIITHDDAMDVLTQEYNEGVEMLMAIAGPHEGGSYIRMSPRHLPSR
jgi:magnesium transporter